MKKKSARYCKADGGLSAEQFVCRVDSLKQGDPLLAALREHHTLDDVKNAPA